MKIKFVIKSTPILKKNTQKKPKQNKTKEKWGRTKKSKDQDIYGQTKVLTRK